MLNSRSISQIRPTRSRMPLTGNLGPPSLSILQSRRRLFFPGDCFAYLASLKEVDTGRAGIGIRLFVSRHALLTRMPQIWKEARWEVLFFRNSWHLFHSTLNTPPGKELFPIGLPTAPSVRFPLHSGSSTPIYGIEALSWIGIKNFQSSRPPNPSQYDWTIRRPPVPISNPTFPCNLLILAG